MLEAEGLVKYYGKFKALRGLNLKIEAGEVFCLLGANGAGKSTTIQLFLGFIQPTAGRVRIDGLDVAQHPVETKKRVAYIPENVRLYPNLTGLENLEFFTALAGRTDLGRDDLRAALDRAGLPWSRRPPVGGRRHQE
ncbi:MAG: ATP-binding cassette domain-containing protein, partial [Myxococcota bacterium]